MFCGTSTQSMIYNHPKMLFHILFQFSSHFLMLCITLVDCYETTHAAVSILSHICHMTLWLFFLLYMRHLLHVCPFHCPPRQCDYDLMLSKLNWYEFFGYTHYCTHLTWCRYHTSKWASLDQLQECQRKYKFHWDCSSCLIRSLTLAEQ